MHANTITFSRLLLSFVVIVLFGRHHTTDIALIFTIALVFILDAIDGFVARKYNETSKLGELLDTIADRIIENTFWIYFAVRGLIPLWIPITVMARGFLIDGLRQSTTPEIRTGTFDLTRSRTIRGLYGGVKMFAFMSLASLHVFEGFPGLEQMSLILATFAVTLCVIRAFPTCIEVYKNTKKRDIDAKHVHQVPQSTE